MLHGSPNAGMQHLILLATVKSAYLRHSQEMEQAVVYINDKIKKRK